MQIRVCIWLFDTSTSAFIRTIIQNKNPELTSAFNWVTSSRCKSQVSGSRNITQKQWEGKHEWQFCPCQGSCVKEQMNKYSLFDFFLKNAFVYNLSVLAIVLTLCWSCMSVFLYVNCMIFIHKLYIQRAWFIHIMICINHADLQAHKQ